MSSLRRTLHVACGVDRAFATFTERIDAWWPRSHRPFAQGTLRLEPGLGGRLVDRSPAGEEVELGEVVSWDPPAGLAYTWKPGCPPGSWTRVTIAFTPKDGGTEVRVLHEEGDAGLGPKWTSRAVLFERGWTAVLAAFDAALAPPDLARDR